MRVHEDGVLFREAVRFTAAETGFSPRLIEKDYFCGLLLERLSQTEVAAVFKGGTCLSKVHSIFYRLSEDLDFAIHMDSGSKRVERSRAADSFRRAAGTLALPFSWLTPIHGANQSRQYTGAVAYPSITTGRNDSIKIEVGLREPIVRGAILLQARTLLLDPITGTAISPATPVSCMSKDEALAEKVRAALTRRDIAIRDFFDIDHFVQTGGLKPEDESFLSLVRMKMSIPGNDPIRIGAAVLEELERQLEAQLKPVLRERDYERFDLTRAFEIVERVASSVA